MNHSPEFLARRRRDRRRRRRLLAGGTALVVVVAGVATALALKTEHRVVVVRAPRPVARSTHGAATQPGGYPAAPGAPSDAKVREALKAQQGGAAAGGAGGGGEAQAGTTGGVLRAGASSSFASFAASLPGRVEVAVQPLGAGEVEVLGGDEAEHGWSTTKVPVLVALLRARGTGGLTATETSLAHAAITESDNGSILQLFSDLERSEGGLAGASRYVEGVLRSAGSDTTVATAPPPAGAATTFGQTEWTPTGSVAFFRALALGCLLPSSQTSYVLGLMESIVSSESWGIGSAGFASAAFKGGWGPEGGGYLVRQAGIVDARTARGAAVAIVASAPNFGAGTEMLTRTASWLSAHLSGARQAHAAC